MRYEDFEKLSHSDRMTYIALFCSKASSREFKNKHSVFRSVEAVL